MTLATYLVRPSRCALVNARTGETYECLFNPPQLDEKIDVSWSRLAPLGLGHHVLQYESTGNRVLGPLDFHIDRLFASALETDPDVLAFAEFMRALTRPPDQVTDVASGAPPRVLLVWPNVLTVEAVVISLELHFTDFMQDGSALLYTATCTFEQILDAAAAAAAAAATSGAA